MAEQTQFRIRGNILVGCTQGLVGDEMLPEGIEIINEGSLCNLIKLRSIVLPASLNNIEKMLFGVA